MRRARNASDYWSFTLGLPAGGSQLGQFSTVSRIDVATDIRVMRDVKSDAHEDIADGMNSLMTVKPFVHQSVECVGHRGRFSERNLVFDHHMSDHMKLEVFQLHSGSAVISHDRVDPSVFIEFEPSCRMRSIICVVAHVIPRAAHRPRGTISVNIADAPGPSKLDESHYDDQPQAHDRDPDQTK